MALHRSLSIPLLLLSLLSIHGVHAGMHVLSVEPYVAEWCAAQFPEQLGGTVTATHMAEMVRERSYKLVEPYLGGYCFDVFGTKELKHQKREETLKKMDHNPKTIQVEPYLMEWGQKAMLAPSHGGGLAVPDVEAFVTKWCVYGQFHRLMKDKKQAIQDAGQFPIKVEPALAPWCFDMYPEEMAGVDREFYVKRMKTDHVKVEDYLMKWEIANFHTRSDPRVVEYEASQSGGGGFSRFLVFVAVAMGVGYVHVKHPHVTQAAQDKVVQVVGSLQERAQGGAGGGMAMTTNPDRGSYNPLNERMVASSMM